MPDLEISRKMFYTGEELTLYDSFFYVLNYIKIELEMRVVTLKYYLSNFYKD